MMQTLLNQHCASLYSLGSLSHFDYLSDLHNCSQIKASRNSSTCRVQRNPSLNLLQTLPFCCNLRLSRVTQLSFCSRNDILDDFPSNQLPESAENGGIQGKEELGLLNKPNPVPKANGFAPEYDNESEKGDKDEILEPFLKFFKPKENSEEPEEEGSESRVSDVRNEVDNDSCGVVKEEDSERFSIEYYDPKPGDFVVGVVVSGNENKLDVNIGADLLGTMLTKEILPLYDKEMDSLLCDLRYDSEEFMVHGKMGIVKDDGVITSEGVRGPGRPVVEAGTVIFAEVLGRTLSGRPLLSTRRYFRRIAWHRLRQIKQLNEPIEVKITEWNTGGLLTRIEGLRAFLPKAELVKRVNSFTELKENVGRRLFVHITRINEDKNDLILSERSAWEKLYLREGTLLEGTVVKVFPYGAQVKLGETNRSGLLHISNITGTRIASVSDVLKVDENVKVLVVRSPFPDKISLSIADLESERGLFLSNREKVFAEAEEMAKKYRQKLAAVPSTQKPEAPPTDGLQLEENEVDLYANWKWFKFESDSESN